MSVSPGVSQYGLQRRAYMVLTLDELRLTCVRFARIGSIMETHPAQVRRSESRKGSPIMAVTLRELTDVNREAVLALHVTPEQERFVGGSVQNALADAAEYPQAKPWYRAV